MNRQKKQKRDANALLGELFETAGDALLYTITSMLGEDDVQMAEDCLSETFLLACQRREELFSSENPRLWLVAAAKECVLRYKHSASEDRKCIPLADCGLHCLADENGELFIEEIAYRDWVKDRVPRRLLNELPPNARRAFFMKYQDGLSNLQIAKKLHMSESAVRACLAQSRRMIEEKIKSGDF